MIRTALTRFLRHSRGSMLVDYAMAGALIVTCQQLAASHGDALSGALRPLLPA